ncbi:MAG: hypothetical protein P8077_03950, partial [Gammaproteobacteria bacterium]
IRVSAGKKNQKSCLSIKIIQEKYFICTAARFASAQLQGLEAERSYQRFIIQTDAFCPGSTLPSVPPR